MLCQEVANLGVSRLADDIYEMLQLTQSVFADGEEGPLQGCGYSRVHHQPAQASERHFLQEEGTQSDQGDQEVCSKAHEDEGRENRRQVEQSCVGKGAGLGSLPLSLSLSLMAPEPMPAELVLT